MSLTQLQAGDGQVVVLVGPQAQLHDDAVDRLARELLADEGAELAYADEVRVSGDGQATEFRKPVWSPERLRCQPYLGEVVAIRTALFAELGGVRDELGAAALYDLQLRAAERTARVVHVPQALATVPEPGPLAAVHLQAVQEHLGRLGLVGTVALGEAPGTLTISRELDPERRVSIVIPTNGAQGTVWGRNRVLVVDALASVLEATKHPNLEVVVVYDEPTPTDVLAELRELLGERLILVPYDKPFSHSEKCNLGVLHSTGDRIVLLNDDVEAISERWLEELVAPLDEPGVGMTGAKLYLANTRIQHAGHVYADGNYTHVWYRALREEDGPNQALRVNREASGVTAAVAAMRRDTFIEVGGFSEALPTSYNDIDLCHKVRAAGYRIVWLAGVELYHFGSKSRGRQLTEDEQLKMQPCLERWGVPEEDEYLPVGAR